MRGVELLLQSGYLSRIFAYTALYGLTGTTIYLEKLALSTSIRGAGARASFSAKLNLLVALGTLAIQLSLSARVVKALGVARTLQLLPAVTAVAVAAVAANTHSLALVAGVEVVRKVANYAVTKPLRASSKGREDFSGSSLRSVASAL